MSEHEETLWQIAREVAEIDSTCDGEEDIHGVPVNHFCPFCGNEQIHADRKDGKEFLHRDGCIVTKARELMEWREAQPRVNIVNKEVPLD